MTFSDQWIAFTPLCRFATSPPQGGRSDPHGLSFFIRKNENYLSVFTAAVCWKKADTFLLISPLEGVEERVRDSERNRSSESISVTTVPQVTEGGGDNRHKDRPGKPITATVVGKTNELGRTISRRTTHATR